MSFTDSLIHYFALSSPYLLVGFTVAGFIHQVLNAQRLKELVSSKKTSSVFWAAILGVPLPLCSCSVIPAAVTLKKSGASNGATSSFLIATPESGIDSILVTKAMMDPLMTIVRPLAAFITAFSAGVLQLFLKTDIGNKESGPIEASNSEERGHFLTASLGYSFGKLINDLALWLTIGLFLGALIQVLVPDGFFNGTNPHIGRLGVLLVGIPFYICATASTPIAASLVLKGMDPGTALLLLLVGPATNISNIVVLQKYLGKTAILINLLTIALLSLGFSYGVDFLYAHYDLEVNFKLAQAHGPHHPWWVHLCSIVLGALLLKGIWVENIAPSLKKRKPRCH